MNFKTNKEKGNSGLAINICDKYKKFKVEI